MTPASDYDSIDRLRAGDSSEFERLFRAHYGPLCGFVQRYVGTPELAEELVQETFLTVWRERASLRVHTSLRAYLYAAARNRALNTLKRSAVEARWSDAEARENADAVSVSDAERNVERAEVQLRVRDAVARLSPRLRETVELRWGRQWSHAEVAEAMGISVKAVEANVARAKAALRDSLGDLIE